jgi:hypothetical protein
MVQQPFPVLTLHSSLLLRPHPRGTDARADVPAAGPLPGGAAAAAAVLLELAMDEKLLGRSYAGWAPYA